ncbi:MAG: MFS transporter [Deltaproteobacteria bacterium]|nr:MFS transporter [Deltaproteobacteria bacterium]
MIFALALVHFIGDFYASFINPMLPLFVDKFSLNMTQVGLITGISRMLAFVVQPSVGYFADRYPTRMFFISGLLLAIVFIPLTGIAPLFLILILFVALGSIGQSMFHPPCAGMVSTYSGPNFGFCMSVFLLGCTLAFGVGPLFITTFARIYGLEASPWTMIIGLPVIGFLFKIAPKPVAEGFGDFGFLGSMKEAFGDVWRPLLLLWIVMVLRAFAGQSFSTFVPVLYTREGYSLVSIGAIVSLFTVGGALSGLLAGHLSDRIGYKPIFYASHGLATPAIFMFLMLGGNWVYINAFLSGFLTLATFPVGVDLAQKLAPRGKYMVSSLMMGLAFGTGGMMTPVAGKLADIFSIRPVLYVVALLPLITIGFILFFPELKRKSAYQ